MNKLEMKIAVIGSGASGFECVKRLTGDVLWISMNDYMTKKWVMPALLMNYTDSKKNKLTINIPEYIKNNGMDVNFVIDKVAGIDTRKKEITAKDGTYDYDKLVIATGSLPKIPKVEIEDNKKIATFDTFHDFIDAKEKIKNARNIAIVGSGPIGFELSMRLSARYNVTIIEHDHDLLMHMLINHPLYRYIVRKLLELRGVNIHLSTSACSVREDYLYCRTIEEDEFFIDFDVMIFATGVRQSVPVIDSEDFHKDRVLFCNDYGEAFVHERGGIRKRLKDVYSIGDATCYLTKKNYPASATFSEKSAKVAAFNIMRGNKKRIKYHPSLYYRFLDTFLRRLVF